MIAGFEGFVLEFMLVGEKKRTVMVLVRECEW